MSRRPRRLLRRPPDSAIAAGAAVCVLVAACAALAWPEASPVAAQPGGTRAGDRALSWAFLGCAIGAFAAYVVGLLLLRRGGRRLVAIAAVAAVVQLVPLGAPLLLSTDAWTYWDYGRLAAVHGLSPYSAVPTDALSDPAFPYVGVKWQDKESVYGPAFTLASEPLALAAGSSADAAAWIWKALGAAAVLAAAVLAARLSSRPAFALAFVGWNPLLALHFAGGGHNDSWIAALVLGALALGTARRPGWAGVAWAAAVLVKWVPLMLLPLRGLEARRHDRRVTHLPFALAFAAIAAVATWRYGWRWVEAPLGNAGLRTTQALPHRLSQLGVPYDAAVVLLAGAFVVAYAWLLREAWRGRARLGLATALLLLAVPYLVVWYVAWTVPLAAAEDDEPAQLLALALCAYLLRQTIPL